MSAKRWLNGTTSRNANSTWTPGSATRSSPSSCSRLRSSRSFSVSSLRPVSSLFDASMPRERSPPAGRRAGSRCYLELDPDEEPEPLPPERDEAERLPPERDEAERLPPERDEAARLPPERDEAE